MKVVEFVSRHPARMRRGVGVHYAERGGGAVLRGEARWYKVCGIWINTPWGCVWLRFRRFYK